MTDNPREAHAAPGGATLRAFIDHAPVFAFIKDDQGRYLYVNPTMERLFGVTFADIRGKGGAGWLPPALAQAARQTDPHLLATGQTVDTIDVIRLADGTMQHWRVVKFPFTHADGRRFIGGMAMDVTELHRAQSQLADSERRYRHLVESAEGLICTHDMEGRLLTVNRAALESTGATAEAIIGRKLGDLLSDASREQFPLYLERIRHVGSDTGLMFVRAKDGRELVWQYRNVKIEEPGQQPYVLGHAQDVTDLRDAQEQLRQLAMTDDLTGLHNRRGFFMYGSRLMGDAVKHQKGAVVLYVDINGLKLVNDTYGHDAGSALIVSAADVLKNTFRAADVVARLGGDEFVALAMVSRDDAGRINERLKWHLDKFNAQSGLPYPLDVSAGMAFFDPGTTDTLEGLVKRADEAMYRRKRFPLQPPQ